MLNFAQTFADLSTALRSHGLDVLDEKASTPKILPYILLEAIGIENVNGIDRKLWMIEIHHTYSATKTTYEVMDERANIVQILRDNSCWRVRANQPYDFADVSSKKSHLVTEVTFLR